MPLQHQLENPGAAGVGARACSRERFRIVSNASELEEVDHLVGDAGIDGRVDSLCDEAVCGPLCPSERVGGSPE
jgi:hypothetical protein